jgi:hypothetical protein
MQNFFGQLYLDLSDYLKTAVPELRWIDQDFGQLEHFEYRPEVTFPCALIDFAMANYSAMAGLTQIGEVSINIRLGFSPFSKSYQLAPMNVKKKALEYYSIEQKVFEAIHGWAPETSYCQPLIRVSTTTEQRDNDAQGLRVRVLTFSTAYEDESKLSSYQKKQATMEIDISQ